MGIGQFNISQATLKTLSDAELAMHCQYMGERYKQAYKMKFDCKLPLDNDSYELIDVSSKKQNEFKKIFKEVMKDKITEAKFEFMNRDTGDYTSNVKEVLRK